MLPAAINSSGRVSDTSPPGRFITREEVVLIARWGALLLRCCSWCWDGACSGLGWARRALTISTTQEPGAGEFCVACRIGNISVLDDVSWLGPNRHWVWRVPKGRRQLFRRGVGCIFGGASVRGSPAVQQLYSHDASRRVVLFSRNGGSGGFVSDQAFNPSFFR